MQEPKEPHSMPSHHAQADVDRAKQHARQRVWTLLDRAGVTLHRASVSGKIPNFVGADAAADQLAALSAWRSATVVKVNPDKVSRFPSELATTVHPLQIIDEPLPEAAHDFRVHLIVTTDETISCRPSRPLSGLCSGSASTGRQDHRHPSAGRPPSLTMSEVGDPTLACFRLDVRGRTSSRGRAWL
jgi:hypothetical protein